MTSKIRKIAFVGDHLPRKCGIATFTTDLLSAVATAHPQSQCFAVSVNDIKGATTIRKWCASKLKSRTSRPICARPISSTLATSIVCLCSTSSESSAGPVGGHILALLRS